MLGVTQMELKAYPRTLDIFILLLFIVLQVGML